MTEYKSIAEQRTKSSSPSQCSIEVRESSFEGRQANRAEMRLRLGLPKGRMAQGINQLIADAGIRTQTSSRDYRPELSFGSMEVKLLKPQAIVTMLAAGSRDIGFAGADWVAELDAPLVELLDTGLDPVQIVAAAPVKSLQDPDFWNRPLVVASEMEVLTNQWIKQRGLTAEFLRSYGSTEVYPPEDADCIVDVVATGATLKANGLNVTDVIMTSSTRLYASPITMERPEQRRLVEEFVLLLRSVLEARQRVMVEVNVTAEVLEKVVASLPCMREPTIATLHGERGYAIKVAAPKNDLPALLTRIKSLGGTDIVVSPISQIVP
ncbi:MAG: ATP phosphoribosyltransferase [Pirellulaceae bacterium]|nr:ATP phosphoribosyltransferase [Pirellulaceae bacterium]